TLLGVVLLACLVSLPEMRKLSYRADAMRVGFTLLNAEIESYRTQRFSDMSDAINDSGGGGSGGWGLSGFLGQILSGGQGTFGSDPVSFIQSETTLNDVDYTIDTTLRFEDEDEKLIRTT